MVAIRLLQRRLIEEIVSKPTVLSSAQKEVVTSPCRYIRVIAGAGAGKTETLTRRILYLLLVGEIEPSSIVAFTFTERAAQGMKSRIYRRMLELGREDLGKRIGEMYIGTIHAFCYQVLQDYFEFGNWGVFDENEEMAFLNKMGWSLGLNNLPGNYSHNCEIFLNTVNVFYGEMLDREIVKRKAPDFYGKLVKYENLLDDAKRLTFGRMVYECVRHLRSKPEVLSHISHLLVDEFQDVDRAQFELVKLIGTWASVFVVGDPRQTIYQWRGSNERYFREFIDIFGEGCEYEIPENRRSGSNIVKLANGVASTFRDAEYEDLEPTREDQGNVVRIEFSTDIDEAQWVAEEIQRLVDKGKCRYSDFGILLRSVATAAEPFMQAFRERNIPFLVGGKVGLFRRPEAQAVGRLFCWLHRNGFWVENPYRWSASQVQGDNLLHSAIQFWDEAVDFPLPRDLEEKLIDWKNKALAGDYVDFKDAYYHLLVILGYHNFDLDNPMHLVCMANLGRFSGLLRDYESAIRLHRRRGGRGSVQKINIASEARNLCWFINTYASRAYEEKPVDDLRQINAVQILTIHQAKGLEWPIVFLPSLVNRRFPSSMAGSIREWHIPRDLFDARRYEGGEEEELRLFYVALTRAKDVLVLSNYRRPASGGRNKSPSPFVDLLDEEYYEIAPPTYHIQYTSKAKTLEEEDILTFSTTELLDFLRCPHHYRLNKIWGYIQDFNELIGYGDALHFCLRRAAEIMNEEGLDPISAVATAVDEEFFLPFASHAVRENAKKGARNALINFAKKWQEELKRIVEVESRLEFPIENATIVGKVDVIKKGETSYEIWDYKTSDRVISEEDSALQLRLYSLGLKGTGWEIESGAIAYLEEATVKPVSVKDENLLNAKEIAKDAIEKIRNGHFAPRPSPFCKECEYRELCRWRRKS
ncbi:MAG: ATP-dependent helicase [Thermoplasmata archaeon]|nr:MAG: ATP-dependent helicase [Thermoplasmata archaeon]